MGLFDFLKKKEEPKPPYKVEMRFEETPIKPQVRTEKRVVDTFTTILVGSSTKNRQAALATVGEGERLSLSQRPTNSGNWLWYVGFKGKDLGTVPDAIQNRYEKKFDRFHGKITSYKITKDKSGLYQCEVTVDVIV